MVEPSTVSLISSLTLVLARAWSDDDFELDGDAWSALREFVTAAPRLLQMFGDEPDEELGALLTRLSVEAFREALRRHWGGSQVVVPERVHFWQRWSRQHQRYGEIRTCIETALDLLAQPSTEPVVGTRLPDLFLNQPESSPIYQSLLAAFDEHGRDVDPPLLDLQPGRRTEFDRQYRAAWKQLLTRKAGAQIMGWLDAVAHDRRQDAVHDVLLGGLADWTEGHVFAAHQEVPGLPWMPPEDFYIEPRGRLRGNSRPLCELIEAALNEHTVVLVTADFGYGKSLTARTLAARWARSRMMDGPKSRSPIPIYLPCGALDWSDGHTKIRRLIRRAWMQQLLDITGEKLADDDPALKAPDPREPTRIILDGLDEVRLGNDGLRQLLERIKQSASTLGRRFLLFCRPGLLSSFGDTEGLAHICIEPFGDHEVDLWLRKWSYVHEGLAPTRVELEPVAELISVPILLFMVAYQWSQRGGEIIKDQLALYERFAATLARGKLEATREHSPRVRETARVLARKLGATLNKLRKQGVAENLDDEIAALLWLMGHVAWLGYREQGGPGVGISEHDIDGLLRPLGIERDEQIDFHRVSLLTCMQGRLDGAAGERYLFFGHRSFHEFFVARFWRDTLVDLCTEEANELRIAKLLIEGELIPVGPNDDKALGFLLSFLARLNRQQLTIIGDWARRVVCCDAPSAELQLDSRWHVLQAAALAIYCELVPEPELAPTKLRAILAKMWEYDRWRPLWMPRLRVRGANFSLTDLSGSNLRENQLEGANFEHTKLAGMCFDDANLTGSTFAVRALAPDFVMAVPVTLLSFDGTNLTNAEVLMEKRGVSLVLVRVQGTNLTVRNGAVFQAAHGDLRDSKFYGVTFTDVKASADFTGALFRECYFDGCDFSAAIFDNTRFFACDGRDTVWPGGIDLFGEHDA